MPGVILRPHSPSTNDDDDDEEPSEHGKFMASAILFGDRSKTFRRFRVRTTTGNNNNGNSRRRRTRSARGRIPTFSVKLRRITYYRAHEQRSQEQPRTPMKRHHGDDCPGVSACRRNGSSGILWFFHRYHSVFILSDTNRAMCSLITVGTTISALRLRRDTAAAAVAVACRHRCYGRHGNFDVFFRFARAPGSTTYAVLRATERV